MIPESMRKELEKLADELTRQVYPMTFHENDRSVGRFLFKEGAAALENLIMKSRESEFALEKLEKFLEGKMAPYEYIIGFESGARWQHQSDQLIIGALKMGLDFMNKNCISLSLHESRVQQLEAKLKELEK